MYFLRAPLLGVAIVVLLPLSSWADEGLGLKLQRTLVGPPKASADVPTFIFADRLEGLADKEATAQGYAEIRKGNTNIEADLLKYYHETEEIEAEGNVRIELDGNVVTGPSLKYHMRDSTGVFDHPEFTLKAQSHQGDLPVAGRGHASEFEFVGENRFRVRDAFFTTCKPEKVDWYLRARELDIDMNREVATAHGATIVFKDIPIVPMPYLDFSLNNARKSGFLPPHFGTTGKSGPEFTAPYYFNLAPNYDATLSPRYMEKRGTQLGLEYRYLQQNNVGQFTYEYLPNDQLRDQTRTGLAFIDTYHNGSLTGGLNLNKVSDDNYFVDLGSRINVTSQVNLVREGFLSYSGNWWGTGTYAVTGRIQAYQTLQTDPANPVPIPYARRPQLVLSALRQDVAGLDLNVAGEYVDFTHPTQVIGTRSTLYPSVAKPLLTSGSFLTPKFGVSVTHYELSNQPDPTVPSGLDRVVPITSVDSGLVFERDVQWRGQGFTQTLEPRAYYVYIPFRDQNQIPLFDTAVADLNYSTIYSENQFAGGDRINDANQITLGVSTRMLVSASGQEAFRATIAQRFYFEDQRVTLNPTDTPRTFPRSDWLAAFSGRLSQSWTVDLGEQYSQEFNRTERVTVATRYQPAPLKTLNLSYRYLRDQIDQVDVSTQWPIAGGWYGVARLNYELSDRRIVEALGGIEYNADCWIWRIAATRYALTAGSSTTALFLQLELNGFSRLGTDPLEALKRNVPGYQRLNAAPTNDQQPRVFD
jgi:LPS-assembly protein